MIKNKNRRAAKVNDFKDAPLNKRLKEVRLQLNLSQTEFAGKLDVKQGTLSDIERGRIGVSTKLIASLTENLGVNVSWMYTGEGKMFIENDYNLHHLNAPLDASLDGNWLIDYYMHLRSERYKDPRWEQSFTIQNQLIAEHGNKIKKLKNSIDQYWEVNRRLFQFADQFNEIFGSKLHSQILERLRKGDDEKQILEDFQLKIEDFMKLTLVYEEVNKYLEDLTQKLLLFDNEHLMNISGVDFDKRKNLPSKSTKDDQQFEA